MNRKLNVGLSLAAGLLGGMLSHYISPATVHAQAQMVPQKEIRAQSFVLVDGQGATAGVLGFDKSGNADIQLFDKAGKLIWSAGRPNVAPASSTLLQ
jgi:hypothetical protein